MSKYRSRFRFTREKSGFCVGFSLILTTDNSRTAPFDLDAPYWGGIHVKKASYVQDVKKLLSLSREEDGIVTFEDKDIGVMLSQMIEGIGSLASNRRIAEAISHFLARHV